VSGGGLGKIECREECPGETTVGGAPWVKICENSGILDVFGRKAQEGTGGDGEDPAKIFRKRYEKWIDSPAGTDMIPLPRDGETVTADSKGCPPLSVVSVFPPAALQ
jgi:hypothetical protein